GAAQVQVGARLFALVHGVEVDRVLGVVGDDQVNALGFDDVVAVRAGVRAALAGLGDGGRVEAHADGDADDEHDGDGEDDAALLFPVHGPTPGAGGFASIERQSRSGSLCSAADADRGPTRVGVGGRAVRPGVARVRVVIGAAAGGPTRVGVGNRLARACA